MRVSGWLYLLEQTISSACLLMASGLCTGMRLHSPWRLLLLSPMLAVVTMAAQPLSLPLRLLVLLPAAALSPILVWPAAPLRIRLRMALYSPALSLMLSGLLRLLAPLPLPGFLLLLIGCTALSLASLRASGSSPPPRCTAVDLRVGAQRASLSALVDSGNLLRDSVTGRPVVVISRQAAAKLMILPPEGTLLPGMRLMTVRTVSGTGLMTILRPDSLRIRTDGTWQSAEAVIGISPDGHEGFQALVPSCLMSAAEASPCKAISQITGG